MYNIRLDWKCCGTAEVLGYSAQWTYDRWGQAQMFEKSCICVSFANYWSSHGDHWGQIVHLARKESDLPEGYYIWAVDFEEQLVSLIPFMGVLGYLQIVGTLQFGLLQSTRVQYYIADEGLLAKTVHDDFYKNESCLDHHGCSYTEYIVHIINKLSSQADLSEQKFESRSPEVRVECCDHHGVSLEVDRSCNVSRLDNVNSISQGCKSI